MSINIPRIIVVAAILAFALVYSATALSVTVAAFDSPASARTGAGYLCNGVNDQTQITSALQAVSTSGGGTVTLTQGTFAIRYLSIPANVALVGSGPELTGIRFTSAGNINLDGSASSLKGVAITGPAVCYITASHVRVSDVNLMSRGLRWAAFAVENPSSTIPLEDIEFSGCVARDCDTTGFMVSAPDFSHVIRNIRFLDCRAENCGATDRFNNWVVGFDLTEKAAIDGMLVDGCYAAGNWESGFHFEDTPAVTNAIIRNCRSENNGLSPGALWGAGYVVGEGTVIENCQAGGNQYGYFIRDTGVTVTGCTDTGSRIGFILAKGLASGTRLANCVSRSAKEYALAGQYQNNVVVTGFVVDSFQGTDDPIAFVGCTNTQCDWQYAGAPGTTPVATTTPIPTGTTAIPTPEVTTSSVATATVRFTSTPAGAEVVVDGVVKGVTPMNVNGLAKGEHRVELKKAGYMTWSKTITVTQADIDQIGSYNPRLIEAPATQSAYVKFTSTPAGAKIYIDGVYKGVTPATIPDVSLGTHRVQLRLSGYKTWTKTIQVTTASQTRIESYNPTLTKI